MHENKNNINNVHSSPKRVFEAVDLAKLVQDPKRLKNIDTHVRPTAALIRKKIKNNGGIATVKDLKSLSNEDFWWEKTNETLINKYEKEGKNALKDPELLWTYIRLTQTRIPEIEKLIASDPKASIGYINAFFPNNRFRFKLAEPYLATNGRDSLIYAKLLEKPFPLGEKAIAKTSQNAFDYATSVLNGPFPLGEKAISRSAKWSCSYARIIGKRFKMGEPAIAKNPDEARTYISAILKNKPFELAEPHMAKTAKNALFYAYVTKKPFPLGEPAIAKSSHASYNYAKHVLKKPFPLGEPAIYDSIEKGLYQSDVLKGKPWTGLDQKVDEAIDLKKLVSNPKKLKTHDTHISAEEAYERLENGEKDEYLIHAIAKDAEYSYKYARYVLKNKPFPLGEPAIAKSAGYSHQYAYYVLKKKPFPLGEPAIAKDTGVSPLYAQYVLKGPFPLGEPAIAKRPGISYEYARDALKGPFPLGEPAIAKNAMYSCWYALMILKKPFPLGEPAIYKHRYWKWYYKEHVLKKKPWTGLKKKKVDEVIDLKKLVNDPKKLKTHDTHISPQEAYERLENGEKDEYLIHAIAKDANYSYIYAHYVLHGPFPLGEPVIAKSAGFSYWYARDVLKGPFPLGEPAIATDAWNSYKYAQYVLKGPFPLGEPVIANDMDYSYVYARDVLKGPFPLGEPEIAKSKRVSANYLLNVLQGKPWTGLKKKKVDEVIDLKKLVSDPEKLKKLKTHVKPTLKLIRADIIKRGYPTEKELEMLWNIDNNSYSWLKLGNKKILTYDDIKTNPDLAYYYVRDILKGPFPEGEPAIAKNASYSCWYAEDVLKKPFPLGEPAIATNAEYSYYYALEVLKKKPFPLGEPAIAKDSWTSYVYAKNVLKKPWPLGEPAIAKNKQVSYQYTLNVLKGRSWTGLKKKKVKEALDLKKLVSDPKKLSTYDTHISPEEAFEKIKNGERDEYLVKVVATSPEFSYLFAKEILKYNPFPLGEPAIATHTKYSYYYARYVLEKPFPLGEPAIAKDSWYAYWYAREILEKPFPLGEPAIAKEPIFSCHYALLVLKGPFPLGEPAIATDKEQSYRYARDVLHGPFPLGEPAIAEDKDWSYRYEKYVLKGRPWTGLGKKVDEAIDLKNLVSDPKKLKTVDTHISPEDAYYKLRNYANRYGTKRKNKYIHLLGAVLKSPKYTYDYAYHVLNGPFPEGEPVIAKDSELSLNYARSILHGSFPLGEPAIAKSTEGSYIYAKDVLEGPFPLGEPAIAKDAYLALMYAKHVLRGPFPEGEREIAKYPNLSMIYAKDVLKGRFPLGERLIYQYSAFAKEYRKEILKEPIAEMDLKNLVTNKKKLKTYKTHVNADDVIKLMKRSKRPIKYLPLLEKFPKFAWVKKIKRKYDPFNSSNPDYILDLIQIIKRPIPELEPAIAPITRFAYVYAMYTTRPFPLGEPAIAKSAYYSYLYAKYIINGRFPLGEPAIAKEPIWAYSYAVEALRGRFEQAEDKMRSTIWWEDYKMRILDPLRKKKKSKTNKIDENNEESKTMTPREAYDELVDLFRGKKDSNPDINLLNIIITDPEQSFNYAIANPSGPFSMGEPIIATDPKYSYLYATKILKKRFPLGEPAIATDPELSFQYAKNIMKGRFRLGEASIAAIPELAVEYAKYILKVLTPKKQKK